MTKLNFEKVKKAIEGSEGSYPLIANRCGVTYNGLSQFLAKPENIELENEIVRLNEMIDHQALNNINTLVSRGIKNDFYNDKLTYEASKFRTQTEGKLKRRNLNKLEVNLTGKLDVEQITGMKIT